jgi:hypothetical protein
MKGEPLEVTRLLSEYIAVLSRVPLPDHKL